MEYVCQHSSARALCSMRSSFSQLNSFTFIDSQEELSNIDILIKNVSFSFEGESCHQCWRENGKHAYLDFYYYCRFGKLKQMAYYGRTF